MIINKICSPTQDDIEMFARLNTQRYADKLEREILDATQDQLARWIGSLDDTNEMIVSMVRIMMRGAESTARETHSKATVVFDKIKAHIGSIDSLLKADIVGFWRVVDTDRDVTVGFSVVLRFGSTQMTLCMEEAGVDYQQTIFKVVADMGGEYLNRVIAV